MPDNGNGRWKLLARGATIIGVIYGAYQVTLIPIRLGMSYQEQRETRMLVERLNENMEAVMSRLAAVEADSEEKGRLLGTLLLETRIRAPVLNRINRTVDQIAEDVAEEMPPPPRRKKGD